MCQPIIDLAVLLNERTMRLSPYGYEVEALKHSKSTLLLDNQLIDG